MSKIPVKKIRSEDRRTYFPFGFLKEFHGSFSITAESLPRLCSSCIKKLLPEISSGEFSLTDVKGGDARSGFSHLTSGEFQNYGPAQDEILLLAGEFRNFDGEGNEKISSFSITVCTRFKEFQGAHHIVHSVTVTPLGEFPDDLSPIACLLNLDLIKDLTIHAFRISMDLFSSRFTSVLGFAPVALDHLLIEVSPTEGLLSLKSEGVKDKAALPLTRHERTKEELVIESLASLFAVEGLSLQSIR